MKDLIKSLTESVKLKWTTAKIDGSRLTFASSVWEYEVSEAGTLRVMDRTGRVMAKKKYSSKAAAMSAAEKHAAKESSAIKASPGGYYK